MNFRGRSEALIPFLQDPKITDILINGPGKFFIEKEGELTRLESPFPDPSSLVDLIERLLVPIGKRVDATQPYIDGRMEDGSRFHIILPPIAADGPYISIRKFRSPNDTQGFSEMGPRVLTEWLEKQIIEKKNLLICGGTGVGKTTLLSRLLSHVPESERIALIEETREIQTLHPHTVFLETRTATPDGVGEVTLRTLIRNALRMRPDRVVLGECRGEEAFDLIQAMNTGHRGSLCTLHANGARDALRRLEGLLLLTGVAIPISVVREWVGSTLDHVVYLNRENGRRQISEVMSVHGLEGEVYRIRPRFTRGQVIDFT